MKQSRAFTYSIAGSMAWLFLSTLLAGSWIQSASQNLPVVYVIWVVEGIALLPGYLLSAMFLSNLLHNRIEPLSNSPQEPITVLICARNEEQSMYRTIEAVVTQQYDGCIEILCVDNGSTDGTKNEIHRAMAQLQNERRCINICQCSTPGKAYALNKGLSHVQTRYFLTVDADTLLEQRAILAIMDRIMSSGAACVAGSLLAAETQTWVQRMQIYDYLLSIAAVKRYQGSYGVTLVAQGAFSAYETAAVRKAGGWTQCAGEDIVLTYRLLAQGRSSLYEPRAIGYTLVPATLRVLCRQRIRWARGMFEGLHAVKPWQQPALYGGYFESLNLSIIYLDLAYVFGFLVGVGLAILGMPWFVSWVTLLMLPGILISSTSVYRFQRRIPGVMIKNSLRGACCFLVLFQAIQSICSIFGYMQALMHSRLAWKS